MTISMRYLAAKWERVKLFLTAPPAKPWPLTYEELLRKAEQIRGEQRERICFAHSERKMSLHGRRGESAPLL
jgi:hypothetical protein